MKNWKERKDIVLLKLKSRQYYQLWYLIKNRLKINLIMKPIGVPIAILIVPIIYAIRPFLRINFLSIPTGRLGHLLLQPEIYMRKKKISTLSQRYLDVFFTSRAMHGNVIANKQVLKMLKRNILILDSYILSWLYFSVVEWLLLYTDIVVELTHIETAKAESLYKKIDSSFSFTDSEVEKGNTKLKTMGINPEKDWFVLIFARDSAYLSKTYPQYDWGYHDWRNTDINSYKEAVKYIIDKGGYVLRMGSVVKKKMDFSHTHYIDYARNYWDDFMDVFLVSRCKFLLGTNSGFSDMAVAFDKPRAIVNSIPLGHIPYGRNDIYIPKKYMHKSTLNFMSLKTVLENNQDVIFDQEAYLGNEYEYIDNSPKEILELTIEMMSKLDNSFFLSDAQQNLLNEYMDLFDKENSGYGIKNPIGINFLESNEDWIFNR